LISYGTAYGLPNGERSSTIMPDTEFQLCGPETPEMIARATELVKMELQEYSLEELVNYEISALWRKHL
jgi:hypothetical protein